MNTCIQCGLNAELDNDDLCEFCFQDNLKEELALLPEYPKGLKQCHLIDTDQVQSNPQAA